LNLARRSFQVIDFGTNRKRIYIPISGQCQLGLYLAPFQRYGGLNVENEHFPLPHSYFRLKFGGVPFGIDPSCWSVQRVKRLVLLAVKLVSKSSKLYDHDTSTSQTDRRIDGRTTCLGNIALRLASRGNNNVFKFTCADTSHITNKVKL